MLHIKHERGGVNLTHEWGMGTLSAFLDACKDEPSADPEWSNGLNELFHTGIHVIVADRTIETSDGIVDFKAGDIIHAWR